MSRIGYVMTDHIDKVSLDPDNPNYKVEKDWVYKGYRCVVIAGYNLGHRCGYVGVNKTHPLYGVHYGDNPKILQKKLKELKKQQIGKRGIIDVVCFDGRTVTPAIYFNVHGGITYSKGDRGDNYPVESDLWWFGYDCGHCDDARDLSMIKNEEVRKIYEKFNEGTIRNTEYCVKECESLADQLKVFEKKR